MSDVLVDTNVLMRVLNKEENYRDTIRNRGGTQLTYNVPDFKWLDDVYTPEKFAEDMVGRAEFDFDAPGFGFQVRVVYLLFG